MANDDKTQALIDKYVEKWAKVALQTGPLDRSKLRGVTDFVYGRYGVTPPPDNEIHVFPSPEECWEYVCRRSSTNYEADIAHIKFPVVDGCYDAQYMAFCDYAATELGTELTQEVKDYCEHMQHVNFIWGTEDYVVFCDHPSEIHYNEEYRPHNESGPSVRHGKYSSWHINGVRVNEQIVLRPETQTIEQILRERNNDVQEIRIERYGWLPFLEGIKAKVLDERANDIEGTWEALYDTKFGRKFVATCTSGKIPVLSVPPSVNTCEQASRWLAGDEPIRILART